MSELKGSSSISLPLLPEDSSRPLADEDPSRAQGKLHFRKSKTLYDTAMSAALFLAKGDDMGNNPAWHVKHVEAGTQSPADFRILDRKAAYRQSKGVLNIHKINRDQELFSMDPFHTMMEMQTSRLLVSFWVLYCLTFAFFAIFYWMSSKWCGIGCDTYFQALLLSVETMLTIGYGVPDPYFRLCPWLVVVLVVESLVAVLYDVLFVGVVYQRISRGTNRASTVLFSDKAVIRTIGDSTFLIFRVCEMRRTQLLDSHLRSYLFTWQRQDSATEQPGQHQAQEHNSFRQSPMRLEQPDDSLGGQVLLILPTMVVHRIDDFSPMIGSGPQRLCGTLGAMSQQAEFSPLQRSSDAEVGCRDGVWCSVCGQSYPGNEQLRRHIDFTAEEELRDGGEYAPHASLSKDGAAAPAEDIRSRLLKRMETLHMEVMCILEGVDAKTSSSVQVRHSYTVDDMVWDSDFAPCVHAEGNRVVTIDFARFHDLVSCDEALEDPLSA